MVLFPFNAVLFFVFYMMPPNLSSKTTVIEYKLTYRKSSHTIYKKTQKAGQVLSLRIKHAGGMF